VVILVIFPDIEAGLDVLPSQQTVGIADTAIQ
jgi:hypothetical protein